MVGEAEITRGQRRGKLLIAAGIGLAVIMLAWVGWKLLFPYAVGPEQPLPFSHAVHAGVRQISCLFCHDGADRSPSAGMPEVGKCFLCHQVIAIELAPVAELRDYYFDQRPMPWVRVNRLPDYVHFTHELHLARGVDCGYCHGDVKAMDRVQVAQPFKMGFCIDCHRQRGANQDCSACHY